MASADREFDLERTKVDGIQRNQIPRWSCRFSIPWPWKEEYEPDGGGTFYEDGPDTGTLRLNVTTAKYPSQVTSNSASEALHAIRRVEFIAIEQLPQGNAVAKSISRTEEQNQQITIHCWSVANAVPPQHVRIANFTYTVLSRIESDPNALAELEMLDKLIRDTKFSSTLGN